MKKAISLILALLLCVSLAVPALAEDIPTGWDAISLDIDVYFVSEDAVELVDYYGGANPFYYANTSTAEAVVNISEDAVLTAYNFNPDYKMYVYFRRYEKSAAYAECPIDTDHGMEYVDYSHSYVWATDTVMSPAYHNVSLRNDGVWNDVRELGSGRTFSDRSAFDEEMYGERFELPSGVTFKLPYSDADAYYVLCIEVQDPQNEKYYMSFYCLRFDGAGAAAAPAMEATAQTVAVNGAPVATEAYNINGYNYFKLRDLAYMLNGTGSQFSVGYDESTATISVTTGESYVPLGSEMAAGTDNSDSCVSSAQTLLIDGEPVSLTAYNIGGYNFFKLRDLGDALGFGVDFDEASNTAVITSAAEDPGETAPVSIYSVWPVKGEIARPYAMAELIFDATMQDMRTHDGIDIAADQGAFVRAAASGRVAAVYDDERLGTTVVIEHSDGLTSIYSNLAAGLVMVSAGNQVGAGMIIGMVGDTALAESAEASHLHFAMRLNGAGVDPADYLP